MPTDPKTLIADVCGKLDLPMPPMNDHGRFLVSLPDGFTVEIATSREHITFFGQIRPLPENADEANHLCREMLTLSLGRTNQECQETLPSLIVEEKHLCLRQTNSADLSESVFEALFETFVNLMEKWRSLANKEQSRQMLRVGGGMMPGVIMP